MSLTQICFINLLKPVDDVRSFYKLAKILGQTNKYQINIIGFEAKFTPISENICFHAIAKKRASLFYRIILHLKTLKIILQVKPKIVVVSNPDLLPLMILIKILFGTKLVYDIQENHFRNIKYQTHYPFFIKWPLAFVIRSIEWLALPFIHQFILAEKIYYKQVPIIQSRTKIWENKYLSVAADQVCKYQSMRYDKVFVYTGTISLEYGTDLAIEVFEKLLKHNPNILLVISGFGFDRGYIQQLKNRVSTNPNIYWDVDENYPKSYVEISSHMANADFAFCSYRKNRSFEGKLPTKYFEYAALKIPMLIHLESPEFTDFESNRGLRFDFNQFDPESLWENMLSKSFYSEPIPPEQVEWLAAYEQEILDTFSSLS